MVYLLTYEFLGFQLILVLLVSILKHQVFLPESIFRALLNSVIVTFSKVIITPHANIIMILNISTDTETIKEMKTKYNSPLDIISSNRFNDTSILKNIIRASCWIEDELLGSM